MCFVIPGFQEKQNMFKISNFLTFFQSLALQKSLAQPVWPDGYNISSVLSPSRYNVENVTDIKKNLPKRVRYFDQY